MCFIYDFSFFSPGVLHQALSTIFILEGIILFAVLISPGTNTYCFKLMRTL